MNQNKFNEVENEDNFVLSENQIEEHKRKKVWNKRMAKVIKLVVLGFVLRFLTDLVPGIMQNAGMVEWSIKIAHGLLGLSYSGCFIGGALSFVKALHEPLTEQQEKEFQLRNAEQIENARRGRFK